MAKRMQTMVALLAAGVLAAVTVALFLISARTSRTGTDQAQDAEVVEAIGGPDGPTPELLDQQIDQPAGLLTSPATPEVDAAASIVVSTSEPELPPSSSMAETQDSEGDDSSTSQQESDSSTKADKSSPPSSAPATTTASTTSIDGRTSESSSSSVNREPNEESDDARSPSSASPSPSSLPAAEVTTSPDTTAKASKRTSTSSSTVKEPTRPKSTNVSCPSGPKVEVAGSQLGKYRETSFADSTVFDARSATWSGLDEDGKPVPWMVTLRTDGNAGSCWVGGVLQGPWDDTKSNISWEEPYHHAGGFTISARDFTLVDVRIDNQGDGIRIVDESPNAMISGAHLTDIHDDCIENDDLNNMTIQDSLLDGCYVGFSARAWQDDYPDRSNRTWVMRDTLVRLEPQPTVYKGPSPGHGGFFKWDENGPKVELHNMVFRADQLPNHGNLGFEDGVEVASCSNNTMVWLGPGEFPDKLPSCFTITTDKSVWTDAVAAWHREH